MPIPFAILAALALSAGSAGANMMAQNSIQRKRDDYNAAERIRQKKLDAEAQGLNTKSQDRYKGYGEKEEARAKELGDYFAQATAPAADDPNAAAASLMPSSSSAITVGEQGRQNEAVASFGRQQGQALGDLRAFGDLLGGTSRLQARDAGLLSQVGGFKTGSANVLPLELDAANQAGGGYKLLGDVLGLAGTAVGAGANPLSMFSTTAPVGTAGILGSGAAKGSFRAAQQVGMNSPSIFARFFR